jgi:hypothetical protein
MFFVCFQILFQIYILICQTVIYGHLLDQDIVDGEDLISGADDVTASLKNGILAKF